MVMTTNDLLLQKIEEMISQCEVKFAGDSESEKEVASDQLEVLEQVKALIQADRERMIAELSIEKQSWEELVGDGGLRKDYANQYRYSDGIDYAINTLKGEDGE